MISVSSEMRQAINQPVRDGSMFITKLEYEDTTDNWVELQDVMETSISFEWPSSDYKMWTCGLIIPKKLEVKLKTSVHLTGKYVRLTEKVRLNDDSTTDKKMVGFLGRVDSIEELEEYVTFTAYDDLYYLKEDDLYESELTYPAVIDTVYNEILNKVNFKGSRVVNGTKLEKKPVGYSYKGMLSKLAELHGQILTTNSGGICIRAKTETNVELPYSLFHDIKFSDPLVMSCVSFKVGENTLYAGTDGKGQSYRNEFMTQDLLDSNVSKFTDTGYYGLAICKMAGDPTLELGDVVSIVDDAGNKRRVIIMGKKDTYDGGLVSELFCYADPQIGSFKETQSITRKMSSMKMDIDGLSVNVQEHSEQIGDICSDLDVMAGEINMRVSKNDVINQINLSTEGIRIDASRLDIDGYTTFTSLETSGETVINGDNITTGTIKGVGIDIQEKFIVDYETGFVDMDRGNVAGWRMENSCIFSIDDEAITGVTRRTGIQAYGKGGKYAISVGYLMGTNTWEDGYFKVEHTGRTDCTSLYINGTKISEGTSDVRLKKDISDLDERLKRVYLNLNPKQYKLKANDSDNKVRYGIMAQDLIEQLEKEKVETDNLKLVEKVKNNPVNDEEELAPGGEHYRVEYECFHALHIQMIKGLYSIVNKQGEEIERLKNLINSGNMK